MVACKSEPISPGDSLKVRDCMPYDLKPTREGHPCAMDLSPFKKELNMEEKAFDILNKLAEKLNVTVDYLWNALVRQAKINGIETILFCILLFAVLLYPIHILKKVIMFAKEQDKQDSWKNNDARFSTYFGFYGGLFVCIVIYFLGLYSILDTLTNFMNPEYWAFEKVIELVKTNTN